jgi:ATP phosphoribosyltransferase regulatory subunit
MQAGLECIGDVDLYAMGEVLSMADESLAVIQGDYLLDLSHLGIVSGLLEGLEEDTRQALLTEIERKNLPAIQSLCKQLGLPTTLAERAGQLALLYGPPEAVLPVLERMADNDAIRSALDELKALCRLLEAMGRAEHLRLDFSIVGGMRYYNGIIFRGYLPGLAASVLAGGRYDNLLRRMGKRSGAIGFAVYLDQLERLEQQEPAYDVDTLLLYGPEDDPEKLANRACALRSQGRSVRVERDVPPGLRYRTLERLQERGK